jgi:hypothetical protein
VGGTDYILKAHSEWTMFGFQQRVGATADVQWGHSAGVALASYRMSSKSPQAVGIDKIKCCNCAPCRWQDLTVDVQFQPVI